MGQQRRELRLHAAKMRWRLRPCRLTADVPSAGREHLLADIHDPYAIGALWPLSMPAQHGIYGQCSCLLSLACAGDKCREDAGFARSSDGSGD